MDNLIVIPTYNEKENIEGLTSAIFENLPEANILFIDDNSPDGTGKVAETLKANNDKIHVMHRKGKLGLASAYLTGYRWALDRDYKYICGMDCDFSHDPKILPTIFTEIKNYDYIVGSRYVKGGGTRNWGLSRRIISYGGNLYARLILGCPVHDMTGAYTCFRRETLLGIGLENINATGYIFCPEIKYKAYKKGFSFKEIPFIFPDREAGQSKMNGGIFIEGMLHVIKMRLGLA